MNALRKYSAEMKNMNMMGSRCLSARQQLDASTAYLEDQQHEGDKHTGIRLKDINMTKIENLLYYF